MDMRETLESFLRRIKALKRRAAQREAQARNEVTKARNDQIELEYLARHIAEKLKEINQPPRA